MHRRRESPISPKGMLHHAVPQSIRLTTQVLNPVENEGEEDSKDTRAAGGAREQTKQVNGAALREWVANVDIQGDRLPDSAVERLPLTTWSWFPRAVDGDDHVLLTSGHGRDIPVPGERRLVQ